MPWGAAIGAVAGLAGAAMQADAAGDAADRQSESAANATAEQRRQYDQTREDFAPYREAGKNALAGIQGLIANPNGITQDPGYQFGLGQGQAAIDRSAASHGALYSGATLKALQRYGADYGSTKLGESFNRLASVAGLGQTATGSTAAVGANAANQIGQNALGAGNVQAAAGMAGANAWGNAFNGSASALGRANWGALGGGGGAVAPSDFHNGAWWAGGAGYEGE